ncbi:type IVB secretion system protein IcmH/DotU [Reyranella sp. CPCC 100927]|uniref:type IVB secretion system protein IcmH/DotU n=1 Tax=Reyranella sp. CPCC 100927 TaxID=2599616 RepID=UPI0011B59847|nr:type IVB secretion system protein IcmH/DotU [Reyranella sp. CPCC 100927]TWT08721.1 OmpA family protein [Reyranella sp. CPCC 100927]
MAGNPNDPFGSNDGGDNRTVLRPGGGRPQQPASPQPPGPAPQSFQPPPYQPAPQQAPSAFDAPPAGYPPQQQQQAPFAAPNQRGGLAAVAAGRPGGSAFDVADLARGTGSPLAAAAVPLLGLSARLRAMTGQVDVNAVRESVYQELHGFAKAGREANVQPELLRASHYAVAATIDDVVMNTPWGAHSGWNKRTMVSAFHGDVEGGERFYAYLERMTQAPTVNRPVLQIMYDCMSLGFLGRYRLRARGPAEHDQVREKVWQILRNLAGPLERELSPDWRGVDAPAKLQQRQIPIWLVATLAAVLAALLFGAFLLALNVRSGTTQDRLEPLLRPAGIDLPKEPVQPVVKPRQPDPPPAISASLRKLLEPEITAGKVTVTDKGKALQITINFKDMFEVGSAKLRPELSALLTRIGQELKTPEGQGKVKVIGHTDSDPIATAEFKNNEVLSRRRAENSADVLIAQTGERSRYEIIGRAALDPVAPNTTAEGKARNRRVEILLVAPDEN